MYMCVRVHTCIKKKDFWKDTGQIIKYKKVEAEDRY